MLRLNMKNLTSNQVEQLVTIYPFLKPINVWTGRPEEDFEDNYYVGQHDLPHGWSRLFLMYCKELRPHLIKSNIIDKFYFTQVKEKYGTMRLYYSGYPASAMYLNSLYETFSYYICQRCGCFATRETKGWVATYCDDCISEYKGNTEAIQKHKCMQLSCFKNGSYHMIYQTYKYLKKEYIKVMRMNHEEFFKYIITV